MIPPPSGPHSSPALSFPTTSRGANSAATPVHDATSKSSRRRQRWWFAAGLVLAGCAVAAVFAFTEFEWATLLEKIKGLNPFLLFLLMATLPVGGFSIGIVYLIAGAKFGPWWGGAVVAAATACHLLLTHWIMRSFLRAPLQRLLARRRHHPLDVRGDDHRSVSLMVALVPGPPYFLRNYLLALSSIPLRTYFWICLPVYVARSYVTIFLGDLGSDPSKRAVIILVAVYLIKLAICAWLLRRLRRRHRDRPQPAVVAAPAN